MRRMLTLPYSRSFALATAIFIVMIAEAARVSFADEPSLSKPNVLFIAIDDLNDWIGPLDGNPQAKTPNLDRFLAEGAMLFPNAVCPAPVCGPSRSAILSGFMPHRTGIYGNGHNMIYSDIVRTHATLPEYFSKHGYHTLSNGKIFHKHATEHGTDFGHWAFDEHARARRGVKDNPHPKKLTGSKAGVINGKKSPEFKDKSSKLSWGPTKKPFEETVDYLVADWAKQQLTRQHDKPFFMAAGIIKPHLPWYVPQEFFDQYDLDSIEVPEVNPQDLDDILKPDGKPAYRPSPEYLWVKQHGLEKEATRAYLANVTYADACLGIILKALDESEYANNTIVVIWGDHGWHLGEKQRYLKNTLWSEAAKVPFLIRIPEMKNSATCDRTVNLIDLYPTLIQLCGLPAKELDGKDFSPLLTTPDMDWDRPGVTVSEQGTSVMTERWHYIATRFGSEELYDLSKDPLEWTNLAGQTEFSSVVADLKKWVPKKRAKAPTKRYPKPKNYVDADADPTIKAERNLQSLR